MVSHVPLGDPKDEPESYFTRQSKPTLSPTMPDKADVRRSSTPPATVISGRGGYPKLEGPSPWSQPDPVPNEPPLGYAINDMPELGPRGVSSFASGNSDEVADRDGVASSSGATSSTFRHPDVKSGPGGFSAYAGKGMTRECIGVYPSFEEAVIAVHQAERERLR